jgi:hypothetical protein
MFPPGRAGLTTNPNDGIIHIRHDNRDGRGRSLGGNGGGSEPATIDRTLSRTSSAASSGGGLLFVSEA